MTVVSEQNFRRPLPARVGALEGVGKHKLTFVIPFDLQGT